MTQDWISLLGAIATTVLAVLAFAALALGGFSAEASLSGGLVVAGGFAIARLAALNGELCPPTSGGAR